MKYLPGYRWKRPTRGPIIAFMLGLPPKLKEALDTEAARKGISVAAYIREVLANHLLQSEKTTRTS